MTSLSTVPLGELMATKSGSVDPSKFQEEIFDLYSIPAYDRRESEVVAGREIGSAKQIVAPGDVLLSKIVPHIRRAWIVGRERGHRLIASGEWIVFRSELVHAEYLRQVLVGDPFHAQFMNTVAGVGGSLLRARPSHVAKIVIPLPPLAEQRWIAEVLDQAEALRAKRRAALAQLDSLTQSLFLDLFGDPATNLKGWPLQPLIKVCSIDAPLVDPTREEFRGLLHYGPDRIERDTGELLPAKTIAEDGQTSVKFLFDENSVLYSKIRPNLNKVALTKGVGLCSADVYPVRVDSSAFTREFLWCLLRSRHFLSYAAEFSNRANIPKINRDQFLGYMAICPPLELQREFARRVAAVERLKASQRAALAELDALFASLQHRAFRGEL